MALVLREGDRHLLLVVGVDDVQLGVAVGLHFLELVGERHHGYQGLLFSMEIDVMERFGGTAIDTCVVVDEKAFGRGLNLRGGRGVGWPHRMNCTISLTMRLCRSWVGVASMIVGLW